MRRGKQQGKHRGIESLESRRLLTAISWTGGAGASDQTWANPLNWSTNTVPTAADDVTLGLQASINFGTSAAARTVSVTATGVTGSGTLAVGSSFDIAKGSTFVLASGSIGGAGTLTVEAGGSYGGSVNQSFGGGSSGNVTLSDVYNYGSYSTTGDHDLGGTFHNYGTVESVESGAYYTRFINEPTGTLRARYTGNYSNGAAVFGEVRNAQGVVSAVPFVNQGLVATNLGRSNDPRVALTNTFGQTVILNLDATPTIGGKWDASSGLIQFWGRSNATPTTAATTVCDSTFSFSSGELSVSDVHLTIAGGIADGAGLGVTGALAAVTVQQPKVSLELLELLGGRLSLGTGGTALRTAEVNYNSAAVFDLGDGTFIDGNQPYFSPNRAFPMAGTPATEPAYADLLRATIGGQTLIVRSGPGTSATKTLGYARGDGLASLYPSGTFNGLPFDSNDFVFRGTLRGDADLDRDVDFADLLALAKHYGQTTARGDADGNFDDPTNASGTVDFADLLALAKNYGQAFTVPAPAAAADRSTRTARVATSVLS